MAKTAGNSSVNNPNRMKIAIVIAIAVHVLVLSITFGLKSIPAGAQRFDITLNQLVSQIAPEDAEFLAQFNQQSSGNQSNEDLITSPDTSELNDEQVRQQAKKQEQQDASLRSEDRIILTHENSEFVISMSNYSEAKQAQEKLEGLNEGATSTSSEVASLEAKLATERLKRSKDPRTHRLSAVAAKGSDDANYLYAWQKRIEQLGNRHYPEEARRKGIFGELQLLVVVLSDGSVETVEILKSSGHRILDKAATAIVETAAPFPVFPPAMKEKYDRVEIVRTWKFQKNAFSGK